MPSFDSAIPIDICIPDYDSAFDSNRTLGDLDYTSVAHESNGIPVTETADPLVMPLLIQVPRKSTRVYRPPAYVQDFICPTLNDSSKDSKYSITDQVDYSGCSNRFQHRALQVTTDVEPTSYSQSCKNLGWIDSMQKEMDAFRITILGSLLICL